MFPTITDYIGALENPEGIFRTLGRVVPERDVWGVPLASAGNSAAVFTYRDAEGRRRVLKCHIRPNRHLRAVYAYVENRRPALLPALRLLRDEMFVHSYGGRARWVDIIEGEWVEGDTLLAAATRAARAGDRVRLGRLADAFDSLCGELLAAEWAHGDLKPENVIVGRGPFPSLTLVDCDAMWIPELAGRRAAESGTPAWRHPERGAEHFDKGIDDYPAALVSVSLRALSLRPELWSKYGSAESLLLSPTAIYRGTDAALAEAAELFRDAGAECHLRMTEFLSTNFDTKNRVQMLSPPVSCV